MVTKILVVDDEPHFEIIVTKTFRREVQNGEYLLHFASNGVNALSILEDHPDIDVVLTDINMPQMDGLTLLEHLNRKYPHLITVIISAYSDLPSIRASMNNGAFDFLVKPIQLNDLTRTVAKTVNQAQQLKELSRARQEREQTQAKLVDNLRKMDKLKNEFLTTISHELNMPLNGIIGIAESLVDGAAGQISEELEKNLEMLISGGRRLSSLVHDLVDFSKLKNKELQLDIKPVNLHAVAQVAFSLAKPMLEGRNLLLDFDIPDDLPKVLADENRLQQILHNLVSNAIKFTENGQITVSAVKENELVKIWIQDTGVGISKERIQDIFDVFEQSEQGPVRPDGGLGLGLTITQRLVQLQGGVLQVASDLGEGSCFSFCLPADTSEGATSDEQISLMNWDEQHTSVALPSKEEDSGKFKVLVVDDEPVNRMVLTNIFRLQNYEVVSVTNGAEALALVEKTDFDLILLDVVMPGMSGFDVCRKLREQWSLFELPILIITAQNRPSNFIEGLKAGANDYLAKPFDKRELQARAQTLLTLKKAMHNAMSHTRRLEAEQLKRGLADNLRKLTETLTSTLEMDEVLNRFLESLAPVAPYRGALVALYFNEDLEPSGSLGYEDKPDRLEEITALARTLFATLSKDGKSCLIANLEEHELSQDHSLPGQPVTLMAVPMFLSGEISGMVFLERSATAPYTMQEQQLVYAFAGQAAIAVENAHLFAQVQTMAKTEELTGLHNRRHFFVLGELAFKQASKENQALTAIMLDVDHFKRFNDTYGHAVGDAVLSTVAQRIKIACRKTDIIGRYGGEEFVILLPQTDLKLAVEVANRLLEEVKTELRCESVAEPLAVRASLGVATYDTTIESLAHLLKNADKALYTAKDLGRNQVVTFDPLDSPEVSRDDTPPNPR